MANRSNHKPIVHERLIMDHSQQFYAVAQPFKAGAFKAFGTITVVGENKNVPLWIIVEWDSGRIFVGYHWRPGTTRREQLGVEEWFDGTRLVFAKFGERHGQSNKEIIAENHDTLLDVTRFCQSILDDADEVSDQVKETVRNALRTGDLVQLGEHAEATTA